MSSTDPIQSYGLWIAAAVLVIAFLLIWFRPRRAPRPSKHLTTPEIRIIHRYIDRTPAVDDSPTANRETPDPASDAVDDPAEMELVLRWQTLTMRQKQVARLVARGLADEEIARELSIAYTTVKTHLREVYRKMGTHSRHHLRSIVQHVGDIPD